MGLADIAALIQRDQYEVVKQETWGHLAPQKNVKYPIEMKVAVGYFSDDCLNPILLSVNEDGPWHGPWFYDSVNEFISDAVGNEDNTGKIMRFVGHWRNYRFVGKWSQIAL